MEKFKVRAVTDNLIKCMAFIESKLERAKVDRQNTFKVLTACEEIIVNIISYGYTEYDGDIEMVFEDNDDFIAITFVDRGKAFNPLQKPDTIISTSIGERDAGGLGILMTKKLMDQIYYEYKDGQNRLKIVKQTGKGE